MFRVGSCEQRGNEMTSDPLFPITIESKAAFINAKGVVVLKTDFAFAKKFSEGLALCGIWDSSQIDPVTKWHRGRYGFMNRDGELAIPQQFDEARDFKDGVAPIRVGKLWGYIDLGGKTIVEPKFDQAETFSEGLGLARLKKVWSVLDTSGAVLFTSDASKLAPCRGGLFRFEKKRKWSYLDRAGATAFELTCTAAEDFSEGLAAVLKDRRIGYIDAKGQWVIPPTFKQASPFREGFARVEFASTAKSDDAPQDFGFIDKSGARNPPGSFASAGHFSEGLAAVTADHSQGWSYIDTQGKTKIATLACSSASEFENGLAVIQVRDPSSSQVSYNYLDATGKIVWKQ